MIAEETASWLDASCGAVTSSTIVLHHYKLVLTLKRLLTHLCVIILLALKRRLTHLGVITDHTKFKLFS